MNSPRGNSGAGNFVTQDRKVAMRPARDEIYEPQPRFSVYQTHGESERSSIGVVYASDELRMSAYSDRAVPHHLVNFQGDTYASGIYSDGRTSWNSDSAREINTPPSAAQINSSEDVHGEGTSHPGVQSDGSVAQEFPASTEAKTPASKESESSSSAAIHPKPDPALATNLPPGNQTPSVPPQTEKPPQVEIFKSFRVGLEDPCYKILPLAIRKYGIKEDWRTYSLYIVYGDRERCIQLEEKPLQVFKTLDREGKKPMFMLRKNVRVNESGTSQFLEDGVWRDATNQQAAGPKSALQTDREKDATHIKTDRTAVLKNPPRLQGIPEEGKQQAMDVKDEGRGYPGIPSPQRLGSSRTVPTEEKSYGADDEDEGSEDFAPDPLINVRVATMRAYATGDLGQTPTLKLNGSWDHNVRGGSGEFEVTVQCLRQAADPRQLAFLYDIRPREYRDQLVTEAKRHLRYSLGSIEQSHGLATRLIWENVNRSSLDLYTFN